MKTVAQEILLEWLADSYEFLLSLSSIDAQARALKAMRENLQTSRQEFSDLHDPLIAPEVARIQAALFREAFDEAAQRIEKRLGLPYQ